MPTVPCSPKEVFGAGVQAQGLTRKTQIYPTGVRESRRSDWLQGERQGPRVTPGMGRLDQFDSRESHSGNFGLGWCWCLRGSRGIMMLEGCIRGYCAEPEFFLWFPFFN